MKIQTILLVSAALAILASSGASYAHGVAIRRTPGTVMAARGPDGVGVAAVRRNGKIIGRGDIGTRNADGSVSYDASRTRVRRQTSPLSGVYAPPQ